LFSIVYSKSPAGSSVAKKFERARLLSTMYVRVQQIIAIKIRSSEIALDLLINVHNIRGMKSRLKRILNLAARETPVI
jgi:hypothetical protein